MAKTTKNQPTGWRNRIVGTGMEDGAQLLANPKNWRIHPQEQQKALEGALNEIGWVQNVIVNERTGFVVDGHARVALAISQGEQVPVVYVDLSEEEEAVILATLDPLSAMAVMDTAMLTDLLKDVMVTDDGLRALITDLSEQAGMKGGTAGLTDPDAVPEIPEQPVTLPGDLWLLGKHRVLCGDSTSVDAVERLMGDEKADMVFTDPPYGISIVKMTGNSHEGVVGGAKPYGNQRGVVGGGGSAGAMYPFGGVKKGVVGGANIVEPKRYAPVINDESTDTAENFYQCALASGIRNYIIFGGNYFTAFLPASPCWVVWDKQNSGNFADVELAWTSFKTGSKLYSWLWNGLSRAGGRKTELDTRVHPTQKPVGLFEKIFADFPFTSCFDGFLGSGSTLIACEKTDRICYGMELSPDYVDVVITRWQDFTGKEATLDGDGRTFDQIKAERFLIKLGAQDMIKEEVLA